MMKDHHRQVAALLQRGESDTALSLLHELLKTDPLDVESNLLMAAAQASAGEFDAVIRYCERVLEVDDGNDRALFNAAIASNLRSDPSSATSYAARVATTSPFFVQAALLRINLLYDTSYVEDARALAKDVCNDFATDSGVISTILRTMRTHHDAETAIALLEDNGRILRAPDVEVEVGLAYYQLGDFDRALALMEPVRGKTSDQAKLSHSLGDVYEKMARYEDALMQYEEALRLSPDSVPTLYNASLVLEKLGRYRAAISLILRCLDASQSNAYRLTFLRQLSMIGGKDLNDQITSNLIPMLTADDLDMQQASGTLLEHLENSNDAIRRWLDGPLILERPILEALADCDLLVAVLSNIIINDYRYEIALTSLRAYLIEVLYEVELDDRVLDLAAALAIQCVNNGYIYQVNDVEKARLDGIKHNAQDMVPVQRFIVLCMYKIDDVPLGKLLSESSCETDVLRTLYDYKVTYPAEENDLKQTMFATDAILDDTSIRVKTMYEHNPYPVWRKLSRPEKTDVQGLLWDVAPWYQHGSSERFPDVLVAGCGTGRHAMILSMQILHGSMTAIDLSASSLAYARRMAETYHIEDIDFRCHDILDVSELGQTYDVIQSVGVLHHMREPDAGLKALVDVLKPGGIIYLGLYSKLGRRYVLDVKERYHRGAQLSDDDIRDIRHLIMSEDSEIADNVSGFFDFYTLDECRDLLFHVSEIDYDLEEIEGLIAGAGLRFIGFSFTDSEPGRAYRGRFGDQADMTDLSNWSLLENEMPDLFSSMYNFWCYKPV